MRSFHSRAFVERLLIVIRIGQEADSWKRSWRYQKQVLTAKNDRLADVAICPVGKTYARNVHCLRFLHYSTSALPSACKLTKKDGCVYGLKWRYLRSIETYPYRFSNLRTDNFSTILLSRKRELDISSSNVFLRKKPIYISNQAQKRLQQCLHRSVHHKSSPTST